MFVLSNLNFLSCDSEGDGEEEVEMYFRHHIEISSTSQASDLLYV